jgi:GNAT superfamily N-acetyltransferase
MKLEVATLKRRPELAEQVERLAGDAWPTFMLHADTPYWDSLFDTFAGFQILFCDPADTLIALGHTIPFVWDGTLEDLPPTIDEVMERAIDAHRERRAPTALSALAALVSPEHQGRGLSSEVLRAMRSLAAEHGMNSLVAPVRPTLKSLYRSSPSSGTRAGNALMERLLIPGSAFTGDSVPGTSRPRRKRRLLPERWRNGKSGRV